MAAMSQRSYTKLRTIVTISVSRRFYKTLFLKKEVHENLQRGNADVGRRFRKSRKNYPPMGKEVIKLSYINYYKDNKPSANLVAMSFHSQDGHGGRADEHRAEVEAIV